MPKTIKQIADYYTKRVGSSDPFRIAKDLNILIRYADLGECEGCYMLIKRRRCIFLNNTLDDISLRVVMAHELGHAILHRTQNCYFIRNMTYLSCSSIEREANLFAAHVLIDDSELNELRYETIYQKASTFGVPPSFVELKEKSMA